MKPNPTIGRIVIYRSRTGSYSVPAIVSATPETLNAEGVAAGNVPALSGEGYVHLTVFTPGKPGMRSGAGDFVERSAHGVSENVAGCYQEWDIRHDNRLSRADEYLGEQDAGTWRWPERVS